MASISHFDLCFQIFFVTLRSRAFSVCQQIVPGDLLNSYSYSYVYEDACMLGAHAYTTCAFGDTKCAVAELCGIGSCTWTSLRLQLMRELSVVSVGDRGGGKRWRMGGGWGEGDPRARARDEVIQQSKYWQVCARSCPFQMSGERAATNISFYYLLLLLTIRPSRFVHVFIYSHTICNAFVFFLLKCSAQSVVLLDTIWGERYDGRMSRIIYSPFSVAYYYHLFHFYGTVRVHLSFQCPLRARVQHTEFYWSQKQNHIRFVSQWMNATACAACASDLQ